VAEKPDASRALVPSCPTWLVFPLLILLVTVVLASLELSGSSVSRYDPSGGNNGLLAGRARPLRTDEWFVRTPLLARQVALDLPDHDVIGVAVGRVSNQVVVDSGHKLRADIEMRAGRPAACSPPEKVGREHAGGDGDNWNLCLTMQTRALHPTALDRALILASSDSLECRVVENDCGCAGVFRMLDLRVIRAVAALQKGDIAPFEIRKLFG